MLPDKTIPDDATLAALIEPANGCDLSYAESVARNRSVDALNALASALAAEVIASHARERVAAVASSLSTAALDVLVACRRLGESAMGPEQAAEPRANPANTNYRPTKDSIARSFPKPRGELVKDAAALIAEIERRDRVATDGGPV